MVALIVGVLLVLLKLLDVAPVAAWDWWWVLAPFAVAVAWWQWSDLSGHTSRSATERERQKRLKRQEERREALGTTRSRNKKGP